MSDEADRADQEIESTVKAARANLRLEREYDPIGECLNGCGTKLDAGERWCCRECREDFIKFMNRGVK